jgi:tetratricopeptide (TPR) repeat protein
VESREALNQLVALGYIEAPDEDVKKTIIRTVRELDYNLARSYTDANRHFDAIPYLAELSENFPDDERFSMTLFHCYHALDEVDKAGRLLEVIVQRKKETIKKARQELADWEKKNALTKPEDLNETQRYDLHRIKSRATANPIGMDYLMVEQLVAKGDFKSALQHLEQIEMLQPDNLGLHIKKGGVYLKLRQYNKATAYFRRALSNDTENVAAYVGLSRTHIYRNRNEDAAQDALAAIGLAYFNPSAHFLLGVALHRMGRLQQAVDALKIAILQNPNFMIAYQRLINIYKKELNDPETAEKYEVRADAAHKRIQDLKAGKVKYHKNPLPNHVASTSDQTAKKSDRKLPGKIRTKLSGTILVVSGLPRSGTSMMMQMLTAGGLEPQTDARRQADIHNEKGYFEDSRIKALQQDNSWLEEIIGKSVKIVAQLLLELPARKKLNYGVIFMERDLDSVMTSQRNFLSDQGDNGAKIPDMLLKQVFHSQLLQVKEFLAARKIPVLYIRYENCIEDPEATAESINRFLGRGLDKKAMAEAIQPSLQRHRKN